MTFADDQIVYRDLDGAWGSFRLIVGGKDVTRFRGVPVQIGGYQLQKPYGYGPADFNFPQITSLEYRSENTGDLAWFNVDKVAKLVQVDAAGNRVALIWKGRLADPTPTLEGTSFHCDGDASGPLSYLDKHPEPFNWTKDAGLLLFDAFGKCGLSMTPRLGLATGIELDERGLSGDSMLAYCDGILALAQKANGDKLTVMPNADGSAYVQQWVDRNTVHGTVFNGSAGVTLEPTRPKHDEPTTISGQGRDPNGQVWSNQKAPGIKQGDPPPFPGTLSLGDSGGDVQTLQSKLVGAGLLDREDAAGDDFDDDTEDAVKDLQKQARLAVTGVVNEATWNALYDLEDTGLSLRQAYQAPLAQDITVQKWKRTANGSKAGLNPDYDPRRVEVERTVDFGVCSKKRARKWAKRELEEVQAGKNWVGTLALGSDAGVVVGNQTHGGAPEGVMSALDLRPGMNLMVRNFDGDTLFHVAGINVDSDLSVRLAVDTKARDLLDVGQRIERNRASRSNPARRWLRERRGTGANQQIPEFSELGGKVWNTVDCAADAWTVFPVIAGQSGSVNRIRIEVTGSRSEFIAAATAKKTSPAYWDNKVGDPFDNQTPVKSLTLDSSGTGYTSAPKVTIEGGGGRGAKAVATISGGVVTDVRLTQRGRGYESAPYVSFSGGGGTGASATANLGATGSGRWMDGVTDDIDEARALLGAWGDVDQPCGYFPGQKTGDDGTATNDPITGVLLDDGGFDYHTFDQPVIWIAVYAKQACKIKPQRVLWPVLEAGM